MGVLSLLASFFPKAKSVDKATIDTDHPASRDWRVHLDVGITERVPISPTRPRGATLPSSGAGDLTAAIAHGNIDMKRIAGRQDGTYLPTLPLPLFTLIAAVCRDKAVIDDLCSCGLLQFCVDRFVLETPDVAADVKVISCCCSVPAGSCVRSVLLSATACFTHAIVHTTHPAALLCSALRCTRVAGSGGARAVLCTRVWSKHPGVRAHQ